MLLGSSRYSTKGIDARRHVLNRQFLVKQGSIEGTRFSTSSLLDKVFSNTAQDRVEVCCVVCATTYVQLCGEVMCCELASSIWLPGWLTRQDVEAEVELVAGILPNEAP